MRIWMEKKRVSSCFILLAGILFFGFQTADLYAKASTGETVKDAESLLPVSPSVSATSRTVPETMEGTTPVAPTTVVEARESLVLETQMERAVAVPIEPLALSDLKIDRRLTTLALLRERPWPEPLAEQIAAPVEDRLEQAKPTMAIADNLFDEIERRRSEEAIREEQFLKRSGELG